MIPTEDIVDDLVDAWHFDDAGPGLSLREFLNMSPEDFDHWSKTGDIPADWSPTPEQLGWIS